MKARKILSLTLVMILVLSSLTTAFAVVDPEDTEINQTINVIVEEGGVAVVNGQEKPGFGNYEIQISSGSAITLEQFSNAGYENDGIDETGNTYTVKFKTKDDVLSATMDATVDETSYLFGQTAQISLSAEVTDGDDDTNELVEVDLYKDGVFVEQLEIIDTFTKSDTYTLPSTESELFDDGFVLDDGVYTKTIKYELTDSGESEVIASAEVDIVKEGNATIYITGDDEYTIYLNGEKLGSGNDSNQWTKLDKYRVYVNKDAYLIAVKGEDTAKNIAGITVTVKFDDGNEHIANNSNGWVRALAKYDDWYKLNYEANENEWLLVTDIDDTDGNWITTNPDTEENLQWIWSNEAGNFQESPVWFRSVAPQLKPEEYILTINYKYEDGTEPPPSHTETIEENSTYNVDSPDVDGYTPDIETVTGTITEDTTVTVTYKEEGNASIFITADDAYELYLDGDKIGEGKANNQWDHLDRYRANIDNNYLLAVKAWDKHQVISGLTVTVLFDDGREYIFDSSSDWMYSLEEYTNWNLPSYQRGIDNWQKVKDISSPNNNWLKNNIHTDIDSEWIWSNDTGNYDESPVYFRSYVNDPKEYTLTINYVDKDGNKVADKHMDGTMLGGQEYNISSPDKTGYTPLQAVVSGTMPFSDVEETVTYTPINYELKIEYVYEDGSQAKGTYNDNTMNIDDEYEISSPPIVGYTPSQAVVSGTMPGGNIDETVTYTPIDYTLTYHANSGQGTLTDDNSPYNVDDDVAVLGNSFTKEGFQFLQWNTLANGEGTAYGQESTLTMPADDVTLYAQWAPNTDTPYTVEHYTQNSDFDGYSKEETEVLSGTTGETTTAEAKSYTGYTFDSNVEGTIQSGTIASDESLVLKLYYKANPYDVSYDANTGQGSMTDESNPYVYGETVEVLGNEFNKSGYNFNGWNTESDGTGTDYSAEDTFEMPTEDVTLYAQWEVQPPINTVSYELEINTVAVKDEVNLGLAATFNITVTNTGDRNLTGINVVDDKTGLDETISLSVEESRTFTRSVTTTALGTLTNTASASGSRAPFRQDSDNVTVVGAELEDQETPEDVPDVEEPEEPTEEEIETEAPKEEAPDTEESTDKPVETEIEEEQPPLDLPDTGAAPSDLFFGLGTLLSGLGVFFTKKRR